MCVSCFLHWLFGLNCRGEKTMKKKSKHHHCLQEQGKLFKRRGGNKTHLYQERAGWPAHSRSLKPRSPSSPQGSRAEQAPALPSALPDQFFHPGLSLTAGHSSSPIREHFCSARLAPCSGSAALRDTMTYFSLFPSSRRIGKRCFSVACKEERQN